jgi:hypothetical protein
MFVLQHALTQGVIRRRAPLDASVTSAERDRLEEGDWLTVRSDSGLFEPVADGPATDVAARIAYPIVIEPSQPDAVSAGLTVVHGDYIAQTDRFLGTALLSAYGAGDVPGVRSVTAYLQGTPLLAMGAEPTGGSGTDTGERVYHLAPLAATDTAGAAVAVAYVERDQADNNGLLQLVVF